MPANPPRSPSDEAREIHACVLSTGSGLTHLERDCYACELIASALAARDAEIARLTQERDDWRAVVRAQMDDMECEPECSSFGHSETCPVAWPHRAWTQLRAQLAAKDEALRALLHAPCWGHGHWDPKGTNGNNCMLCDAQREARDAARAALTPDAPKETMPRGFTILLDRTDAGSGWQSYAAPCGCTWHLTFTDRGPSIAWTRCAAHDAPKEGD